LIGAKGVAGGGLVTAARRLQDAGRGGDDMLVHVNHREAEMLKRMGGAGTINPTTGLHEYKSIFKIFTSIILPAALMFIPGIGQAVGSALGFSGAAASAVGGGILGAGVGGINGGWKGALMGGVGGALGGGFGGQVGSSASSALGLGLGKAGQAMLGSGLIGAGVGAANAGLSGGNALKGALVGGATGAAGGAIANAASGIGTDSAIGLGLNRAGQGFGNALTAGFKPKQAAISGGLAGLAAGLQFQTPEQLASQHSAESQTKLNDINDANKNFSLDAGKQVDASQIGVKPSDMVVNSLQGPDNIRWHDTASLGLANSSPSLGGGQYVTNPVTGAETWVPNQPSSGLLGLAQNTYSSSAPSGGYGVNAEGTPTFSGNQTGGTTLQDATNSALNNQNVLGENNSLGNPFNFYSNAPVSTQGLGTGVNAVGGPTGVQNIINNPNNIYGQQAANAVNLPASAQTAQTPSTDTSGEYDWKKIGLYGAGAAAIGMLGKSMLSSAPAPVQESVAQLSKQQQEYFNRPNVAWDWDKMQQNATARNMSLPEFMAQSWPTIASGQYNVALKAMGGPLARFARGAGSGRDDTIDAKLSDGEYVIDAETVALLGDGSNKAGAQMLDKMRREIRAQKGKALARGKISPNAKSPLAYLRGAM